MDLYNNVNNDSEQDDVPGGAVNTINNDELPPGHSVSGLGFTVLPDHTGVPAYHYQEGNPQGSGLCPEDVKEEFFAANGNAGSEPDIRLPPETSNDALGDEEVSETDVVSMTDVPLGDDNESNEGKSIPATKTFEISDHDSDEESPEQTDAKAKTSPVCKTRRCRILLVVAAVVALLVGGAAVAYFIFDLPPTGSKKDTEQPSASPSVAPSTSEEPSASPTQSPSARPTTSPAPSLRPSVLPTTVPSTAPSDRITPSPSFAPTATPRCEATPPVHLVYNFTQSEFAAAASSDRTMVQRKNTWFPSAAWGCNTSITHISNIDTLGDFGSATESYSLRLEEGSWVRTIVASGGTSECGKETTVPDVSSVLPPIGQVYFDAVVEITPDVGELVCFNPSFLNFVLKVAFISW